MERTPNMPISGRWWWLLGLVLCGWLVQQLMPILPPFLVAVLLAYMGDPLVDRLERLGLSRTGGVLVVFSLFSLACLLILLVLVPMLSKQLVELYQLAPKALDWLQKMALPWVQAKLGLKNGFWHFDQIRGALVNHLGSTTDVLGTVLARITSSGLAILAWLGNLLLTPIVGFYLMRDWDLMMGKLRGLLPRRRETYIVGLVRECHEVLGAFLRGQLLVMLALALTYASGLMLLGLNLGLLIGVLSGLASIVPYMGFVIGTSAALLAALFQFGLEPYALLGVAIVFGVGHLLEGMLLTPWLVGDRIGLHPVAVIFAILAGGQLFGFTGVLLALPVAAVIMVLLRHAHELYKLSNLYADSADTSGK